MINRWKRFAPGWTPAELLAETAELDAFRRDAKNLYERVRALFFLYAIHRFYLPAKLKTHAASANALIPFKGYEHLLQRRFEEAIDVFLKAQQAEGPSDGLCSALAAAYQRLGFQTLADQVRRSVRSVRGNQWMFRMGHPADQPLRLRPELLRRDPATGAYPILRETTPVRMDLTHCGWSDIFFLGMDYPTGAKVLNVSIDLGVHGRDKSPRPPVEAYLRVIEEPVLRLTSVDLGCTADIRSLDEVFDFARDYLGLLKAAVIASGIVPPGIEGSGQDLADLLARIVGPGRGLELVSCVNDIPKGSRLAVSTNLLASLISVCMRATGQAQSLTGGLQENERRLVLARALLGEWLGGSGGGWQDSGGVWPGMKLIEGAVAQEGDPEFGISRGRLMPTHRILDANDASPETRRAIAGLAGARPRRHGAERRADSGNGHGKISAALRPPNGRRRQAMHDVLDEIRRRAPRRRRRNHRRGRPRAIFERPIQTIIPWASNVFTETIIATVQRRNSARISGVSGCWAACPAAAWDLFSRRSAKPRRKSVCRRSCRHTKRELQHALPFAMEPVVYDFAINERGTWADLLTGADALDAARLLRAACSAVAAPESGANFRRCAARSWTSSAPPAGPSRNCAAWCRRCLTVMLPRGKTDGGSQPAAQRIAGTKRLRPRAARANPRRFEERPHRPRPKPPARQRR